MGICKGREETYWFYKECDRRVTEKTTKNIFKVYHYLANAERLVTLVSSTPEVVFLL